MPFDAEPKNGDFAAYVDRLVNRGGHSPGQGLSTEEWAAKASELAHAQDKPAGFGTPPSPKASNGSGARGKSAKSPASGTHKIPGSHQLAGNAAANSWGRSGDSTVPMHSVPSSQEMPSLGSTTGQSRIQQASDTLSFIIKQFNSRRS
jgi:hypothetical protein